MRCNLTTPKAYYGLGRDIWQFISVILVLVVPLTFAVEFSPQAVANLDVVFADQSEPNQTSEPKVKPPVQIRGEIVVMGEPIPGVEIMVSDSDKTIVTDQEGHYCIEVPYRWSGTITPVKKGWVFDPPSRHYQRLKRDVCDRRGIPENPWDDQREALFVEESQTLPVSTPPVALGRLGVTPMVLSLTGEPGTTLNSTLTIQNLGVWAPQVKLSVALLQQQLSRQWLPVEPNLSTPAPSTTCGPWLTIGSTVDPIFKLPKVGALSCPIKIKIPPNARGFYSAALMVQPHGAPDGKSTISYSLVVPILLEVDHPQIPKDIRLTKTELMIPFTIDPEAMPRLRLTVTNQGRTLTRIGAVVNVKGWQPGKYAILSPKIEFNETWIMPGATIALEANYQGPHPQDPLTLEGHIKHIEEQRFTERLMGATATPVPHDKGQPLALLDYDSGHVFKLIQDKQADDPFRTYVGHSTIGLVTNFPAFVHPTVQACSPAQGQWTIQAIPHDIFQKAAVQLTLRGRDVAVEKLVGGSRNVSVAQVELYIIPKLDNWR